MIVIKDFNKNEILVNDMAKKEDKLTKEAIQLRVDYYNNINSEHIKVVPLESKYETLVKEYLNT